MDFDLIWDVIKIVGVGAGVSASLNYIFPAPSSTPTTSALWIDFISAVLQFGVYLTLTVNTVQYIDPGDIAPSAQLAYIWGIYFMPQMTSKFVNWFHSLHIPTLKDDTATGANCSSCSDNSST